jgi:hypothetical protein
MLQNAFVLKVILYAFHARKSDSADLPYEHRCLYRRELSKFALNVTLTKYE